ncbi:hypothetical protein [Streptomyces poonensis]|uniref:hypothetical protein n=1 Tax=Streptomyces poonensis TaxID=68255 RepID=UPI003570FFD0
MVQVLERDDRPLLLDLAGVTRCDNGSLFTILGIRHAANHLGGSLSTTEASASGHSALHHTGLRELLPITPAAPKTHLTSRSAINHGSMTHLLICDVP